jgi:DNA-binding transcriptional LysR family regulator
VDLNNVDLNLLVAFDALLTERSVTKAADRLSVGQSAMSSTLNRLRKLLDDPVLVRQGRGVVATPLAESLVEPVRDALSEIDHVLSRTRVFDPAHDRRRFAVIANDSLTMTVLQPLLARFAREASGVRLDIDSSHEDFAGRLARHEVDLVIVPLEAFEQQSRFPHRTLYHDRYVVAADKDHPDIGDELDLEQFSSLPYLATHAGRRKTAAELQLDWLGVVRKVEATASLSVAPFLLRGTRLITLVLERVARQIAEPAGIRVLEPPITGLRPIAEAMVWTRRTELDPAHQWLRGRLMDLAAEMTPGTATDPEH